MREISTITFKDMATKSDAIAIIKADSGSVWITFSIESNGDIEVILRNEDASKVARAINAALSSTGTHREC
jgi:hypothetical protein